MNVILEQLKTHTQNKPNDIALHIDDETITYSQLNARITSAVESLQKYSLNPVVAINMKSPVQSIICYLALHRLHKVPMMMEGKWQSTIHRQLIEKYGIKDVIEDTGLMQSIDSPLFIDATHYSTTPIYYILVLLQGQLDCQKHIIVMKIHGWLLLKLMKC